MLASTLAPYVHGALGRTASGVDVTLVRLALAASRRKRRRLQELTERLDYYERMADAYAALDPDAFYARPDPIRGVRARMVQRLARGAIVDLSWPSRYEPRLASARDAYLRWQVNGRVHVRLLRHDRPGSPAFVWMHGYGAGSLAVEQRVSRALALYDAGLDVALFTLPFHGARAPGRGVGAPLFPSQGNIPYTNEGFGQMAWDVRGLVHWLRAAGAPSVGVGGMSLGGYCASLLATIEPELSYVIPFIPLADFTDAVIAHEELRGIAIDPALAEASRRALAIHRPLARKPVVAGERVLVIGAEADRITGRLHAERLADHFDAELTSFRGGHILQYDRDVGLRAMRAFARRHAGLHDGGSVWPSTGAAVTRRNRP